MRGEVNERRGGSGGGPWGRRRRWGVVVVGWGVIGAGLMLGGCRSPLDRESAEVSSRIAKEAGRGWGSASGRGEVSGSGGGVGDAGLGVLPLEVEGWVALALERHPGLRAAAQRVVRLEQREPQVSAWEDPMLRVVPIGEQAETAAGRVLWQASVSQSLPLPGKLEARSAMAARDAAAARMRWSAMRLEVAADVRRAYWSLRYAQRAAAVVRRDRELLEQFREVAEAKYRAGTAQQKDVLRAQVELAGVEDRLLGLEQQRVSSGGMLNRMVARRIDAPLPELDAEDAGSGGARSGGAGAEAERLPSDLAGWLSAAEGHPRLAALREQAGRYRAQRRLAELERWPDLTVSLNYNAVDDEGLAVMANGDDQWFVGLGISLPLWQGKREAAEREALAGFYEATAMLRDEQHQLAFEVRDAWSRVEAQRRTLELFEQRMLPDAEQAVAAAESSYRAGGSDFLALIDNWRRLTGLRLTYEQAATQLQKDLADLRRAAAWSAAGDEPTEEAGGVRGAGSDLDMERR